MPEYIAHVRLDDLKVLLPAQPPGPRITDQSGVFVVRMLGDKRRESLNEDLECVGVETCRGCRIGGIFEKRNGKTDTGVF